MIFLQGVVAMVLCPKHLTLELRLSINMIQIVDKTITHKTMTQTQNHCKNTHGSKTVSFCFLGHFVEQFNGQLVLTITCSEIVTI